MLWQGLLEEAAQIARRIIEADTRGEGEVMDMEPLVVDARRVRRAANLHTRARAFIWFFFNHTPTHTH